MANRNFASGGKLYSMHAKPVLVDCSFTVTPTNGLGITSFKGPMVQNVFMHTSTTPAAGSSNPQTPNMVITNPNPANGYIVIQLQDEYNRILGVEASIQSPNSANDVKIDNSAMSVGEVYVITTLGNATRAKWTAIGVPAGVTPAVGVSFVAISNGGAGNTLTSRVQTAAAAGSSVTSIEVVGNPDMSIAPSISSQGFGSQIILACRAPLITMGAYTPAGTISQGVIPVTAGTAGDALTNNAGILNSTGGEDISVDSQTFTGAAASLTATSALAVAAPATGSIIRLQLLLSDSSVIVGSNSAT